MPGLLLSLLAGVPRSWVIAFCACVLLVFAAFWLHHEGVVAGRRAATQEITDANVAARKMADDAEKTVDQCYAAGRMWDRDRGLCYDPAH